MKFNLLTKSAMRGIATTYGILVGLAGIEHGVFEILQGDLATDGIMIDAIGDSYRFWPCAKETALTIVPNFLWTGVLAVIFSILVTIWASIFVQRRFGATLLLVLTIILFLVGGGFAPIFLSLLAVASATRINKPLAWWKSHLPTSVRGILAKLWPSMLIVFVIVFWSAVGIQIFGLPLNVDAITNIMLFFSFLMIILLPIAVIVGLAYDAQKLLDLQ
jgi:hypothetical protein